MMAIAIIQDPAVIHLFHVTLARRQTVSQDDLMVSVEPDEEIMLEVEQEDQVMVTVEAEEPVEAEVEDC